MCNTCKRGKHENDTETDKLYNMNNWQRRHTKTHPVAFYLAVISVGHFSNTWHQLAYSSLLLNSSTCSQRWALGNYDL